MRRPEFVGLVAEAVAWLLAAGAQQKGPVRRIGVLLPRPRTIRNFRPGLGGDQPT
jgi:hypothetical protein